MLFQKFKFTCASQTERKECSLTGIVYPLFGIPVYVPARGCRSLRRAQKLVDRSTRQAEKLGKALKELDRIINENSAYYISLAKKKEPPCEATPSRKD